MHPVFRPSSTALITGGASGIGAAIARLCQSHGMNVAVIDRTQPTKPDDAGDEGAVEVYAADVSKAEEMRGVREAVEKKFGGVDLLVLNAGVAEKVGWGDEGEGWRRVMDTNFFGVVNGIATFLPGLRERTGPTAVVITGSKQGITNPPGNPAYNASKAAVKSVAEHLSYDLRDTSTSVHLLVPGWTFTGMTGGGTMKEKPAGAWAPEQVADFLERKMADGAFWAICPDNETSEETDRKRMLWTVGDAVEGRPPLSRWRQEWKGRAEQWMEKTKI